jgi:hypothetical protein
MPCLLIPSHLIPSISPEREKEETVKEYMYTKSKAHLISSHPHTPFPHLSHLKSQPPTSTTSSSPSKPTLNILPPEINLHILLPLGIRIHSSHQPLRPLQSAFVTLLRLSTHETDQVARDICALALDVAKVLLDSAA